MAWLRREEGGLLMDAPNDCRGVPLGPIDLRPEARPKPPPMDARPASLVGRGVLIEDPFSGLATRRAVGVDAALVGDEGTGGGAMEVRRFVARSAAVVPARRAARDPAVSLGAVTVAVDAARLFLGVILPRGRNRPQSGLQAKYCVLRQEATLSAFGTHATTTGRTRDVPLHTSVVLPLPRPCFIQLHSTPDAVFALNLAQEAYSSFHLHSSSFNLDLVSHFKLGLLGL